MTAYEDRQDDLPGLVEYRAPRQERGLVEQP
jgi:hypothetical protein